MLPPLAVEARATDRAKKGIRRLCSAYLARFYHWPRGSAKTGVGACLGRVRSAAPRDFGGRRHAKTGIQARVWAEACDTRSCPLSVQWPMSRPDSLTPLHVYE